MFFFFNFIFVYYWLLPTFHFGSVHAFIPEKKILLLSLKSILFWISSLGFGLKKNDFDTKTQRLVHVTINT